MSAMRRVLREGYGRAQLQSDILAGVVVGVVALPLSMALAIASGVPPQHGLYTAIVGGALGALFGGSRVSVTGPTAAFVVVLAPISAKYGLGGLALATVMAGLLLLVLGLARLGQLIEFVPHPVTAGFTSGIAVVIASLQLKDFLGLSGSAPSEFMHRLLYVGRGLGDINLAEVTIGCLTLAVLLLWPRVTRRLPAPLVALTAAAVAAVALGHFIPGFEVATIHSRFDAIPAVPPTPVLPWTLPGGGGQPLVLSFALVRELLPSAFAIAMLGGIESLLCAVVADGMTGTRHDPDAELVGQGVANLFAPFFGGFAATGALARTATSIRAGAVSPLAAVAHSIFVLLTMLALAPLLSHLPMAALAALLLLVAWNMSEARDVIHNLRVAPRGDVVVLVTCFVLTVVFDMVVSVTVGIMLAALLLMRRMAALTDMRLVSAQHAAHVPAGFTLYEIAGPLFFGAAQRAIGALGLVDSAHPVVLLDVSGVPVMDATGLAALESALARLRQRSAHVALVGVRPQPRELLRRAHITEGEHAIPVFETVPAAVAAMQQAQAAAGPAPALGH